MKKIDGSRVRFAPSPTGELHLGNARTALYNWLFARHHGGAFILRIEDTDRQRSSQTHERHILEDLRWMGMDWDEGPEKNGRFGPYHQYERLEIYTRYLDLLRGEKRIYPCFCSEEELEAERRGLLARGKAPRYLGKCRDLSGDERRKYEAEGRKPVFRFRVGEETIAFDDLIRGPMRFEGGAIGDFIIVRSNGIPAYNFAVVIDDHLMEISHVIRGEDHLSNTAMQMLLYKSLGFPPPCFAHHSLVLARDRSKLSKRHGAVTIREFRDKGILPEAMINCLALLGSSYGEGREWLAVEELVETFSLERMGKGGAVFDEDKLRWLNAHYIRNYDLVTLADLAVPFMKRAGFTPGSLDRNAVLSFVGLIREGLHALEEIGEYIYLDRASGDRYPFSEEARAVLRMEKSRTVLQGFGQILDDDPGPAMGLYARVVPVLIKRTGLKGKDLFMPLRAAVTGRTRGPELARIVDYLGRSSIKTRVERALRPVEEGS
jgi:nondiscriminating glutamyl-tRNA synthetase